MFVLNFKGLFDMRGSPSPFEFTRTGTQPKALAALAASLDGFASDHGRVCEIQGAWLQYMCIYIYIYIYI